MKPLKAGFSGERVEFELLKRLVSIASPFGKEEKMVNFIVSFLEEHGIEVETLPVDGFGDDVIAYLPGRGPTVVLNGHMDTVNLSPNWSRNPWGELDGDRFYGLGSADMKAGLAVLLSLFVEMAGLEKDERPNLIFAAVSDEEGFSRGAWELIRSGKLDGADTVLVAEPTNERLMLGARGRIVVSLKVRGKKAHAARPHLGINAVEELARLVGGIELINPKRHEKLGRGSYCTLSLRGEADGLSVPDYAEAILDRHVVPGEDWRTVRDELIDLAKNIGFRAELCVESFPRPTPQMLPYIIDEGQKEVELFKMAMRLAGVTPEITYGMSVGDFNYFATYLGKPTLVFGPSGGNWHSRDEWVSVSSLGRVKETYRRFLLALSKG